MQSKEGQRFTRIGLDVFCVHFIIGPAAPRAMRCNLETEAASHLTDESIPTDRVREPSLISEQRFAGVALSFGHISFAFLFLKNINISVTKGMKTKVRRTRREG